MEKRYEIEVNTYQQRVNRIQSELDKATNDMKKHLAEYKNLMSVKQSLEKVKKDKIQDYWINSSYFLSNQTCPTFYLHLTKTRLYQIYSCPGFGRITDSESSLEMIKTDLKHCITCPYLIKMNENCPDFEQSRSQSLFVLQEIDTYRTLLEGEEGRLSTLGSGKIVNRWPLGGVKVFFDDDTNRLLRIIQ